MFSKDIIELAVKSLLADIEGALKEAEAERLALAKLRLREHLKFGDLTDAERDRLADLPNLINQIDQKVFRLEQHRQRLEDEAKNRQLIRQMFPGS